MISDPWIALMCHLYVAVVLLMDMAIILAVPCQVLIWRPEFYFKIPPTNFELVFNKLESLLKNK
jgi:hypothetical protein